MGIYTKSVKENSDSEAPNKPGSDVESVVSEGTVSDGSGVLLLPKEIRPKTNQKATVVVQKDAGLAVPKRGKSGVRQLRFRRERARATCVRVLCCLMFVCSVAVVIVSAVGLLQHLRLFPRLGYLPFVGRVGPVPHGPVPHGSDGYHRHLDLTGKVCAKPLSMTVLAVWSVFLLPLLLLPMLLLPSLICGISTKNPKKLK
ncbi:uncharacterized protein LOC101847278 [Aplysia californica]|uniref:Uncharacterized protein LOC101847278 n=1 Tax=Aplysia californica TaxID=6500 RepID=A0ABM1VXE8_APLCA|nr:uncharacterized protein LOC101847278 [Aplysia californica]